MKRWVGLGVIADNIVNIGRTMEKQSVQWAPQSKPTRARRSPRRVLFCGNQLTSIPETPICAGK